MKKKFQCRPHIWNSIERERGRDSNSMACVSCYVLYYFVVMWCDVIMLKFNFISSVLCPALLFFFSFIANNRTNERTIRIVEHFFFLLFSCSLRIWLLPFLVMMSDLYCHWTFFLTHSLMLFFKRFRSTSISSFSFGVDLKMVSIWSYNEAINWFFEVF